MSDEPVQTSATVWDAMEEAPGDAANMRLRSELAIAVRSAVEDWGVTRAEAARRPGITQPRLNDLLRGRIARFSLDALVGWPNAPASPSAWRSCATPRDAAGAGPRRVPIRRLRRRRPGLVRGRPR